MIILFMLFLIQFSIACSCLAVNSEQQKEWAEDGWTRVPNSVKDEVQTRFLCCGFNSTVTNDHPSCDKVTVSEILFLSVFFLFLSQPFISANLLSTRINVFLCLFAVSSKIGKYHRLCVPLVWRYWAVLQFHRGEWHT
jgi:hypothetical protein